MLGLASMLTCCPSSQARNSRLAIRVETETTHDPDNIFLGDLERGSSKVPPAFPDSSSPPMLTLRDKGTVLARPSLNIFRY